GLGQRAFTRGHHFGHRFGRPLERMRMRIPFGHKSHQAFSKVLVVRNISNLESLPLQNGEPLFHLVHPRTMDRWKVQHKALSTGLSGRPMASEGESNSHRDSLLLHDRETTFRRLMESHIPLTIAT